MVSIGKGGGELILKKFKRVGTVLLSIFVLVSCVHAQELCLINDWILLPSRVRTDEESEECYRRRLRGEALGSEFFPVEWVKIVYDGIDKNEETRAGRKCVEVPKPPERISADVSRLGRRAFEYYNFTKDGEDGFDLPDNREYLFDAERDMCYRSCGQYRVIETVMKDNPFYCIVKENGENIIQFKKPFIVEIDQESIESMVKSLIDKQNNDGCKFIPGDFEKIYDKEPELAVSASVLEILSIGGLMLVITGEIFVYVKQYIKIAEEKKIEEKKRNSGWIGWMRKIFHRKM
jgi:hypothetical protein